MKGRVVVVTGASSGIGEATGLRLAKAGAKTVLTARREDRLKDLAARIEKEGGEAHVVRADVADRSDNERIVQEAVTRFGTLDAFVANAGIMPLSLIENLHVDEWERMVDVNIKGVLFGIAASLPVFKEKKAGHYVIVSSVSGRHVHPAGSVYSATKFAVRAFAEGLHLELGPKYGIRTTCIEPGAVATELAGTITDPDVPALFADFVKNIKFMESDDIARAIEYALCQPPGVSVNEVLVRPTSQG